MPIDPTALTFGQTYSRHKLSELFAKPTIAGLREGSIHFPPYTLFFVTLDKEHLRQDLHYDDFFDGTVFHWDTNTRQASHTPVVRGYIDGTRKPLLFVRMRQREKSRLLPFFYMGRLTYEAHDPNRDRPVKFTWNAIDLPDHPPEHLREILSWRPDTVGAQTHITPVQREAATRAQMRQTKAGRSTGNTGRAGYQADAETRRAVELHAMEKAIAFYGPQGLGYDVTDTSANNPYDLSCRHATNGSTIFVEVKGTQGPLGRVILTKKEVLSARAASNQTDLFIVHGVNIEITNGTVTAGGGEIHRLEDWSPRDEDLTATQYDYRIPSITPDPQAS